MRRAEASWTMRSVQLQTSIHEFLEAAAELLTGELARGAEISFELDDRQSKRGGPSLYCYRPLTVEFVVERRAALEALPEYEAAARQLTAFEGLERYLMAVGEEVTRLSQGARARAAIGSLLGEVFAEQSDFELHEERVRMALEHLHSTALSSTAEVTIVASLSGLTITSPELALTSGLQIARPEALEGLPPELRGASDDGPEQLIVALCTEESDPAEAVRRGREVLRDLLRALRLFGDGRVTLGALAFSRVGTGGWTPLALGGGGRPHGMLVVTAEQEDELRAFCNLVSRRAPHGNELAWALRRFELGCERDDLYEALSDNLLALRALLEPEGPSSGMLPGRLAALCATPERRLALTERTVQAIALERAVVSGAAADRAGARALAEDVADNLRALLRDVICGHLDADLVGLADELLLAEPAQSQDRDEVVAPEGEVDPFESLGIDAHDIGETEAPARPHADRSVPGTIPLRVIRPEGSEAELLGDAGEADEVLDLFI